MFVASIGCAYGCPKDMCGYEPPDADVGDTGGDAPDDALGPTDAGSDVERDAAADAELDARAEGGDAALDGPRDAPDG